MGEVVVIPFLLTHGIVIWRIIISKNRIQGEMANNANQCYEKAPYA